MIAVTATIKNSTPKVSGTLEWMSRRRTGNTPATIMPTTSTPNSEADRPALPRLGGERQSR